MHDVVAAIGGPTTPLEARLKLSSRVGFFADDDRLVAAMPVERTPGDADLALAYGVAYAGQRNLWLILPEGTETRTLARAAFLDIPVRVWAHTASEARELIVPAPA